MNSTIESLLTDPLLARRLMQMRSVGDAVAALVDTAAARGHRLSHDAARQALTDDPGRPRELSAAELLAVSGGTKTRKTIRWVSPSDEQSAPF
ncbi:hypothetical protein [Aquabacterium humicola]|uniref:hypothetical protein n=1 Tax=Aquabacterium humicola TaxID=3237377 RepID=UPI002542838B|nr:hypothetical protein [Rubrivivax pictus]